MSPRPLRLRRISNPPAISGFKPYGGPKGAENTETIFLHLEEYEALRLCDYNMLNHHQASVVMNVSRPTLTRIYASARRKIAKAFVRGLQIIIEGGKIYFDSEWFACRSCGCYFNNPDKQKKTEKCPLCGSNKIINYQHEKVEYSAPEKERCVCPSCGFEQAHVLGTPCNIETCPDCNVHLVRKNITRSLKEKRLY